MRNRLFLIVIYVFSMCLFSACSKKDIADQLIEENVTKTNKQCPIAIDAGTRLDKLSHPEKNVLQYHYTLLHVDKYSGTNENINFPNIESTLVESVKRAPDLAIFREHKVSFIYSYSDKNGIFLCSFSITPEKYGE